MKYVRATPMKIYYLFITFIIIITYDLLLFAVHYIWKCIEWYEQSLASKG